MSSTGGSVSLFLRFDTRFGTTALVWNQRGARPIVERVLLPGESLDERVASYFPDAREGTDRSMVRLAASITRFAEGESVRFSLDAVALEACSAFQRSVLTAEHAIPRGRVSTYERIAAHLGRPRGARAVGRALATNPFPIIVPCHRAIKSDGTLGGYQGGPGMKRALLELEGVLFGADGRIVNAKYCY
ncbi:MAG: methylated-DNA--[protein]-cysteine S-methyltransferase [Candidatus Eisenbacteria bacterium]